jgi:aspartyl/asparaginyl beta-hydroxylase (cupin superfamily)
MVRKNLMKNEVVEKIYENDDILFSMIASFEENTELKPHRDPNLYREPYKRIQIPLVIPDREKCYMIWKGEKVHWTEGEPKVFEVMDVIHEGYNYSKSPMIFLFLDIKKGTIVCNDK